MDTPASPETGIQPEVERHPHDKPAQEQNRRSPLIQRGLPKTLAELRC
jgi:hypothetical protein